MTEVMLLKLYPNKSVKHATKALQDEKFRCLKMTVLKTGFPQRLDAVRVMLTCVSCSVSQQEVRNSLSRGAVDLTPPPLSAEGVFHNKHIHSNTCECFSLSSQQLFALRLCGLFDFPSSGSN